MPDRNATDALACYRCGGSLEALTLPLSRRDLCPACGVELHVCRMCRHYAPQLPEACDEDDAEEVRNKTVANFCDYFAPAGDAYDGGGKRAETAAVAKLGALFGDEGNEPDPGGQPEADPLIERAEDLFRK